MGRMQATAPVFPPDVEGRDGETTPASRREMLVLTAYFAGLILITDALNVRLGVEAMTVAVVIAAGAITRKPVPFLRDWWFFLVGLIMWNLSGPIAAFSPFPWHLDFMLHADQWLSAGHNPVSDVQHALARPHAVGPLDVAAFITYNLHVPEPYIAGYFLWRLNRAVYLQFAASTLLLLVAGFVAFVLFPAVPPWMASTRFGRLDHVYNGFGAILAQHPLPFHGTPLFYVFHWRGDGVAAFPSEHAAFPVLELLAFSSINRLGRLLALWVLWVLFVVVYLGEHWVVDALAGWVLAVACFLAVRMFVQYRSAGLAIATPASPPPA